MYQFLNRPLTHTLCSIHKPNVNRTKAGGHNHGRQIKWAHKTEFCDTWESEQNDTQISQAVYQKLVVYSGYKKKKKKKKKSLQVLLWKKKQLVLSC